MSGTGASLNDKIDLAPWGNAPGDNFYTCGDCTRTSPDDDLHVGHKHSTRCPRHALEARQREIRIYEGDLDPVPDPTIPLVQVEQQVDSCIRIAFIGAILIAGAAVTSLFYWL